MKLNTQSDSTLGTAGIVPPLDGASRSGLHSSAPNEAELRATTTGLMDALYGESIQRIDAMRDAMNRKHFVGPDHYCYINNQPVRVDYDYADDTGVDVTVYANCPTCDTDPYCDPAATWHHEDDRDCNQFAVCDCGYKTQVFYGIPVEYRKLVR